MSPGKKSLIAAFLMIIFLGTIVFVSKSLAQEPYPTRPITMVCWTAAGAMDVLTRLICKIAEKELGQPVVVENKPGAGGVIGVNYVVKSKPDGYTIGVTGTNTHFILPHMRKIPFDPLIDVTDIISLCKFKFGLVVKAEAPWNSLEDAIAYAKKNPGKFTYSCTGIGTTNQIVMERIAMKEGVKWTVVPFKSGGESVMAVLGGHTDSVVAGSGDVLPHIKVGKLKMLVSLHDSRWPELPDVPHILEKEYGFYGMSYISLYGPKGLPESIRNRLQEVFREAMKDPGFVEAVKQSGYEIAYMGGKEYSDLWKSKYDEMGKVIKVLGIAEK